MDTKELLAQANIELREGMKAAFEGLKNYGKASIQHTGAVVKNLKENIKARFLAFKESVKPKVSSAKSKLGRIKTSALEKLNPNNLDVRFRDLVERVEIKTLEAAEKGKGFAIDTKNKVVDYASTVAANYYLRQEEIERERQEREEREAAEREIETAIKANTREHKIGMKEALKEQDRREREARRLAFREAVREKIASAKGKLGTIKTSALEKLNPNNLDVRFRDLVERVEIRTLEAAEKGKGFVIDTKDKVVDYASTVAANYYLRQEEIERERQEREEIEAAEREREAAIKANTKEHKIGMKEALKEQDRREREARRVAFREDVKQKVSSAKGKLGSIKNSLLEKLTSTKDKVSDFFAEQAANHYLRQEERRVERDFKRAQKAAEKEEIEKTKARVRERKADIKYALNAEEREMYEQRHLNNEERKAELMSSLFGQSIENEEVVTSKAM